MNKQFGKICSLLDFLNSNKEQLKPIGLDNLFSGEQLQNEYENWLRLLSKLENPIDNEFFKTTWVPIDKSDLTCFIDIEDPNMAIFRNEYFFDKPYQWFRVNIIDTVQELIDSVNDKDQILYFSERERLRAERQFFELYKSNLGSED